MEFKIGKKEIEIQMKKEKAKRIVNSCIKYDGLTLEKNYRKISNIVLTEDKKEITEKKQKHVQDLTITIEWKKSQMYGYNPHAQVEVHYEDGTYSFKEGYTCTGCGYDKESTVISQIFNDTLKYKLWELEDKENKDIPYGIRLAFDYNPLFEGGIGANCYYKISEFIGGKFELIANTKTVDVYKFTMNK